MNAIDEYGQKLGAPLEIYLTRFESIDPAEVTERTGVPFDVAGGTFILSVLSYSIKVTWPVFALSPADGDNCPKALYTGDAMILLIRYLLEGRRAVFSGNWLSYRELPWGEVYDKNFAGRCRARLAFGFGGKLDAFTSACTALGGVPYTKGDVSYDLSFLPGVTVRLILWAGDEEFPPQSQWLFSDNMPLAFTAEDVAVMGDVIIGSLKELTKK